MGSLDLDVKESQIATQRHLPQKPKICLVFCGGTIAMASNPKTGALEPAKSPEELLASVPKVKDHLDLEILEVFNKDSSNLRPSDWEKIVRAIYDVYHKYDGIVVTHGTDTMAYSAAAVAFALQSISKPIVFTGSQSPLDELGSDATFNLENAFRVATSGLKQVAISFGHFIHTGVRATKISESAYNAFDSPITGPIGRVERSIRWTPIAKTAGLGMNGEVNYKPDFSSGILSIRSDPPLEPWMIEDMVKTKKLKALVIEALGAGNIPEHYHPVIEKVVKEYKLPVVVTSPFIGGSVAGIGTYASGLGALHAGVISSGDMTFPAATVKLSWVIAQIEKQIQQGFLSENDIVPTIRAEFKKNFVGEITL